MVSTATIDVAVAPRGASSMARCFGWLLFAICCWITSASVCFAFDNVILIHGMWAKPESLYELGEHIQTLGYRTSYIEYTMPLTCAHLQQSIEQKVTDTLKRENFDPQHTYVFGHSLGAMAAAMAEVEVAGFILDSPANYPAAACENFSGFTPGSDHYQKFVLDWRHQSDNESPAVKALMKKKSRILLIGHVDDDLIPNATIYAYARASHTAVWWVPGGHEPDWAAVADIVSNFIKMDKRFANRTKKG